jgi:hypothetical protein
MVPLRKERGGGEELNRRIGIVGGRVHDPFIKPQLGRSETEREGMDLSFPPFRA